MLTEIVTLIGILLAVFIAGISVGKFIEKINHFISRYKKDRRP